MKIIIKVNGKKISKKEAIKNFGEERIENRIKESIEEYYNDPETLNTWMDGMEIIIK